MSLADAISWAAPGPMLLSVYFAIVSVVRGRSGLRASVYGWHAVGWWALFVSAVMETKIGWSVTDGLVAAVYTIAWWRNRRKGRGRRALRELGAKSRARVQALVDRMTPSPIPSPAGGRS